MAELPESLKKYVPGPLLAVLTIVWWVGGDQIKDFVQEQFRRPAAHIRLEDKSDNLHVVHVEITRYSPKDFEEVRIEIELQSKPDDIKGELAALDGTHAALVVVSKNPQGTAFFIGKIASTGTPIGLHQRESLEITFREPRSKPVQQVWLNSKERLPIAASDLNQRWAVADIGWRIIQVALTTCAVVFLYRLLVRLFSRRAQKQHEEDIQFLRQCWNAEPAALTKFNNELQPLIDAATAKYLKAFNPATRDQLRQTVIPLEISKRAESLPRFRHSLAGQVQRFVIQFCVDMLEEEYKQIKKEARRERASVR